MVDKGKYEVAFGIHFSALESKHISASDDIRFIHTLRAVLIDGSVVVYGCVVAYTGIKSPTLW